MVPWLHTCVLTHVHTMAHGSAVLWAATWPHQSLGHPWGSLNPDLHVPKREGLGRVRGECRWGLKDSEF